MSVSMNFFDHTKLVQIEHPCGFAGSLNCREGDKI